jgi:hypothetical protein
MERRPSQDFGFTDVESLRELCCSLAPIPGQA